MGNNALNQGSIHLTPCGQLAIRRRVIVSNSWIHFEQQRRKPHSDMKLHFFEAALHICAFVPVIT
jgi:hypothetical protein